MPHDYAMYCIFGSIEVNMAVVSGRARSNPILCNSKDWFDLISLLSVTPSGFSTSLVCTVSRSQRRQPAFRVPNHLDKVDSNDPRIKTVPYIRTFIYRLASSGQPFPMVSTNFSMSHPMPHWSVSNQLTVGTSQINLFVPMLSRDRPPVLITLIPISGKRLTSQRRQVRASGAELLIWFTDTAHA
jgi:hypothetical protein